MTKDRRKWRSLSFLNSLFRFPPSFFPSFMKRRERGRRRKADRYTTLSLRLSLVDLISLSHSSPPRLCLPIKNETDGRRWLLFGGVRRRRGVNCLHDNIPTNKLYNKSL
jgi:hypothetical protein